jgi:hypothetical protein
MSRWNMQNCIAPCNFEAFFYHSLVPSVAGTDHFDTYPDPDLTFDFDNAPAPEVQSSIYNPWW